MLQWMGGARRKVTTTKRSTHNRQKQYFEQRKRQQQTGRNNIADVRSKRNHYDEEPRSLDILSLVNLATIAQQDQPSHKHGSELRTTSPSKISPPFEPRDIRGAHKNECKLDGLKSRKIPASHSEFISISSDTELNKQTANDQNDVSILELLGDDGPKGSSEGKPMYEAHVAFSVEGLGKVGIETPARSPRLHYRDIPSAPKASKRIRTTEHLKPIPYDLQLDLNVMLHDINMSQDDSPEELVYNLRGGSNDSSNPESTKFMFSCVSPNVSENIIGNYNDEETFLTYKEGQKEQWNNKFGISDENFNDEVKYHAAWKSKPCHTEDHPSFLSKNKNSEAYENGFGEPLLQSTRTLFKAHLKSDVSVPSTPCFKHLRRERDNNSLSFEWERSHGDKESSGFDSILSQPDWLFLAKEDSQESMSLLSEESCSSTAEWEGRNYGSVSHLGKLKENQINNKDMHHMSSEKKYVQKLSSEEAISTGLDEAPWEDNLVGTENYGIMSNQWSSKAGYCSTYSSKSPGLFEPECVSLTREGYTSTKVASAPSSCRTSTETGTKFFSCKLVPEDNFFDMAPDVYSTSYFTKKPSKLKIPDEYGSSKEFMFENDILKQISEPGVRLQKSVIDPLEAEDHLPYWYGAGESQFQKHTQFPDLSRMQKVGKDNLDGPRTLGTPQNEDSIEKKSLSSVNSGTAVVTDHKGSYSEHEESRGENQESFHRPTNRDFPNDAEETPIAMEEVPIQHATYTDDKLDHCNDNSPVPSQIKNKESMKEKLEPEKNCSRKGGSNKDPSYQVMLESYVLQLLCVQKVLLEASETDVNKKR